MYLSSTRTAELWPDTLQGWLRAIAVAAVFWALAATLLYLLSPGLDTWPNLQSAQYGGAQESLPYPPASSWGTSSPSCCWASRCAWSAT